MRPETASGRRPLPGFTAKPAAFSSPVLPSKTRPLKRTKSLKSSVGLSGSDLNFLLPSSLTFQRLKQKARVYMRHSFAPLKQVNAMPLYSALKDNLKDNKDVVKLVQSGSNINVKIMRRNSLLAQKKEGNRTQTVQSRRSKSRLQTETEEMEGKLTGQGLAGILREFARRQACFASVPDSDIVQCTPKPPSKSQTCYLKSPRSRPVSGHPGHLPESPDVDVFRSSTEYRYSQDLGIDGVLGSPQYTFISQFVDKWAPKESKTQLKRKLRGQLVRLQGL